MIASSFMPRAFFGGALWGDSALRYIFLDEAGTSKHEPVTVVAGVIVNADEQLVRAETLVSEILGAVPEQLREGFTFHAADVWGNAKYRDGWSMAARKGLLNRMLTVPNRLGLPIVMSMVRRSAGSAAAVPLGLTVWQAQHAYAFGQAAIAADRYVRNYCGDREVATLVAEDVPEMRQHLERAVQVWKTLSVVSPPEWLRPTEQEQRQGYLEQEGDFRITRIRGAVHFVGKRADPMIQIADAVAFAFRRFFAEEEFGDEFATSMLGTLLHKPDYAGPASSVVFRHSGELGLT